MMCSECGHDMVFLGKAEDEPGYWRYKCKKCGHVMMYDEDLMKKRGVEDAKKRAELITPQQAIKNIEFWVAGAMHDGQNTNIQDEKIGVVRSSLVALKNATPYEWLRTDESLPRVGDNVIVIYNTKSNFTCTLIVKDDEDIMSIQEHASHYFVLPPFPNQKRKK